MANILAFLGVLTIVAFGYPALLSLFWLLTPAAVERARQRLERGVRANVWRGLWLSAPLGAISAALIALPAGLAQLLGWLIALSVVVISTIGAAGLAALLATRLCARSDRRWSPVTGFLLGAVALEFGAALPVIGWVSILPVTLFASLGAAAGALFDRRIPAATALAPAAEA